MAPTMSVSRGTFVKHLITAAILACATPVLAAPYTAVYVFGDSLSDRGNLAETGFEQVSVGKPMANYRVPPSNHDSFINGLVAAQVQVQVQEYGLGADPSLFVTGFEDVNGLFSGASYVTDGNYAVTGATSAAAPAGAATAGLIARAGWRSRV